MLYCATRVTYMDMHSSAHAATWGAGQYDEWFKSMNVLYIRISTYI